MDLKLVPGSLRDDKLGHEINEIFNKKKLYYLSRSLEDKIKIIIRYFYCPP